MQRSLISMGMLFAVVLLVAVLSAGGAGTADAKPRRCGFYPSELRTVVDRRHIACARAKRVLLDLRGHRDTIPMICGRSRTIGGWRVTNVERSWSSITNRYQRGDVSFVYRRLQNARRVYCPPERRSSEHV
jgi:hypothetical protein